jgi:peptidoglycan/xylan/chitin deacetylase (PgdA/CDA1 family)
MPSLRRVLALALLLATIAAAVALSTRGPEPAPASAPPLGVRLTAEEKSVWRPLPVSRAGVPVLLYHGIGEPSESRDPADAAYAVRRPDFAKQMALLRAAGYQTITLEQFRRFHDGEPVDLPPHPLLLTFDDALTSSFDGADGVLRELGWTAVMFVDVGAVDLGAPGYARWERLTAAQSSKRWDLQLHAGRGHHNVAHDAAGTVGPFYAYRTRGESLDDWRARVGEDIEWGEATLRAHVPGYRRLAFAPPYGNFGQLATNDRRIPRQLGAWLRARFGLVFVQQPSRYARPADAFIPRLQITRKMAGGEIHAWLARELPR